MSDEYLIHRFSPTLTFNQRRCDGFMDASAMARVSTTSVKKWYSFSRNASTISYIEALQRHLRSQGKSDVVVQSANGVNTWIHPGLCTFYAQWIDADFAVWVNDVVTRYMSGDLTLAAEVVQQHDAIHATTTTVHAVTMQAANEPTTVPTVTALEEMKMRSDIERTRSEIQTMQAETKAKNLAFSQQWIKVMTELGMDDRDKLLIKDFIRNTVSSSSSDQRKVMPISDMYHQMKGKVADQKTLLALGRIAAKKYREKYGNGSEPLKREQCVGGATRMVCHYEEKDWHLVQEAINTMEQGSTEVALMVV